MFFCLKIPASIFADRSGFATFVADIINYTSMLLEIVLSMLSDNMMFKNLQSHEFEKLSCKIRWTL